MLLEALLQNTALVILRVPSGAGEDTHVLLVPMEGGTGLEATGVAGESADLSVLFTEHHFPPTLWLCRLCIWLTVFFSQMKSCHFKTAW